MQLPEPSQKRIPTVLPSAVVRESGRPRSDRLDASTRRNSSFWKKPAPAAVDATVAMETVDDVEIVDGEAAVTAVDDAVDTTSTSQDVQIMDSRVNLADPDTIAMAVTTTATSYPFLSYSRRSEPAQTRAGRAAIRTAAATHNSLIKRRRNHLEPIAAHRRRTLKGLDRPQPSFNLKKQKSLLMNHLLELENILSSE